MYELYHGVVYIHCTTQELTCDRVKWPAVLYTILLFRVEPPVTELYLTEPCQLLGAPPGWLDKH